MPETILALLDLGDGQPHNENKDADWLPPTGNATRLSWVGTVMSPCGRERGDRLPVLCQLCWYLKGIVENSVCRDNFAIPFLNPFSG